MTTKKEGATLEVAKGATAKKPVAKKEAKKSLAELIQFYNEKTELGRLRARYQHTTDLLKDVQTDEPAEFMATDYDSKPKFTFSHDRKAIVSISQPEIVAAIRDFLIDLCGAKIGEIDAKILD